MCSGTDEDWKNIKDRIQFFKKFGDSMKGWVNAVEPILDEFISVAEGLLLLFRSPEPGWIPKSPGERSEEGQGTQSSMSQGANIKKQAETDLQDD